MSTFALSTNGVTWVETPQEPAVEFQAAEDETMRGDGHIYGRGGARLRWFYGDQHISGAEMAWFQGWIPAGQESATIYVRSKNGRVESNGDPSFVEYSGIMGMPTGEINTENQGGQQFLNAEMPFWALVGV